MVRGNIEFLEEEGLKNYLAKGRRGVINGPQQVQMITGIGYNYACNVIRRGLDRGLLVEAKDSRALFSHRIV